MLAGLSQCCIFRMPPGFCAHAGPATVKTSNNPMRIATVRQPRLMTFLCPLGRTAFSAPPPLSHEDFDRYRDLNQPRVATANPDRIIGGLPTPEAAFHGWVGGPDRGRSRRPSSQRL